MSDGSCDGGCVGGTAYVFPGNTQLEDSKEKLRTGDEPLVKERDYMSLGLAPVAEDQPLAVSMDCDNVELSLGLRPPDKTAVQEVASDDLEQVSMQAATQIRDQPPKGRAPLPGERAQQFWQKDFRVSLSNDHHHHYHQHAPTLRQADGQVVPEVSNFGKGCASGSSAWGTMQISVPVPKMSTTPAKRSYQDCATGGFRHFEMQGSQADTSAVPSHAIGNYAWNKETLKSSSYTGFGQGLPNHPNVSGISTLYGHNARQVSGAMPPPSSFMITQAPMGKSLPNPSSAHTITNGAPSSSQSSESPDKHEPVRENCRNREPVVGWPPVRSFRKNTLQATHSSNRMKSEEPNMKNTGVLTSDGNLDVLGQSRTANLSAFFIKAKLDGVRICRKVDLSAYNSYDELKGVLQEMFHSFVSDNAKLDLLHGRNYVVTYEDKDGDYLLVGDVPWHMFLESSVKSLRIMKAMDAIAIGEKGSAKLRAVPEGQTS